jgi:hypothetical protein
MIGLKSSLESWSFSMVLRDSKSKVRNKRVSSRGVVEIFFQIDVMLHIVREGRLVV